MKNLKEAVVHVPKQLRVFINCTIIVCLAVVLDYYVQDYIYKTRYEIKDDDFSHVFQIDSAEIVDNRFILKGWVFKLDEDSGTDDFEIILYDYNNDKDYYMKVEDTVRDDVNEYFLCEYDYSNVGFEAGLNLNKMDLDDINYEVLIRPKDVRVAYRTGTYISNGKIMFVKPESFVPLDVEGTDLEKIVKNGMLRVYRPDVGMYVYQYRGMLYWIADRNYAFEDDGITWFELQMNTTQIERLPKLYIENGWYWNFITFGFEYNEIYELETEEYRIAMRNIPDEHSITEMWTGVYDGVWVWRQYFHPWYEFD